jgi:hypothetical protein
MCGFSPLRVAPYPCCSPKQCPLPTVRLLLRSANEYGRVITPFGRRPRLVCVGLLAAVARGYVRCVHVGFTMDSFHSRFNTRHFRTFNIQHKQNSNNTDCLFSQITITRAARTQNTWESDPLLTWSQTCTESFVTIADN